MNNLSLFNRTQSPMRSYRLPRELIQEIFQYLSPRELIRICREVPALCCVITANSLVRDILRVHQTSSLLPLSLEQRNIRGIISPVAQSLFLTHGSFLTNVHQLCMFVRQFQKFVRLEFHSGEISRLTDLDLANLFTVSAVEDAHFVFSSIVESSRFERIDVTIIQSVLVQSVLLRNMEIFRKLFLSRRFYEIPDNVLTLMLTKAAAIGNADVFRAMIQHPRFEVLHFSPTENLNSFLMHATMFNHLSIIHLIIGCSRFHEIDPDQLGRAMALSASMNYDAESIDPPLYIPQLARLFMPFDDEEIFLALMNTSKFQEISADNSQHDLGYILCTLARSGRLNLLKIFKQNPRYDEVSVVELANALGCAAENEHLHIVREMVSCRRFHEIPADDYGHFLDCSIHSGNHEIFNLLFSLAPFHEMDPASLTDVLLAVSSRNERAIFEKFTALPLFAKIDIEIIGQCLIAAVDSQSEQILDALIKNPRFVEISNARFSEALLDATELANSACFIMLLTHPLFNRTGFKSIFSIASELVLHNRLDVLPIYLSHPHVANISQAHLIRLIALALEKHSLNLLEIILESPLNRMIPGDCFGEIVNEIIFAQDSNLFSKVLTMPFVHQNSPEFIFEALRLATYHSQLEIVNLIMHSPHLASVTMARLARVLNIAAEQGDMEVFLSILNCPRAQEFNREDLGAALVAAAEEDCMGIVDCLISHSRFHEIPSEILLKALEAARAQRSLGAESLLTPAISRSLAVDGLLNLSFDKSK